MYRNLSLLVALCLANLTLTSQSARDSLYLVYQSAEVDSIRMRSANALSFDFAFVDPDSAQYFGEEAIRLAKQLQDDRQLAMGHMNTAVSLHVRGRFNEAIVHYQEALELRIQSKDSAGISSIYNNLGAAYTMMGNYPKALEILNQSYDIKVRIGQLDKSVTTLANIGNIYLDQKKYEEAIEYYQLSLQLSRELLDNNSIIRALNNIGLSYLKHNDPSTALGYYEESLALHTTSDRPCSRVHVLDGLGQAYCDLGRYAEAKKVTEDLLNLSKECEESEKESSALTLLGKINLITGKVAAGESYLKQAYDLASKMDFRQNLVDISLTLYEHYKKQGNDSRGLTYLETYTATRDSLQNRDLFEQLTRVEMEYSFQQERDSIAYQQGIAEANFQAQIREEKTLQYILIAGLVVVAIFALVLYKYYQNKAKTNRLLADQNQQISEALAEREVLMREIHHRVKNNLQVVSSLLNVQSKLTEHTDAKQALAEGRDRVLTMAMIHQKLYRSENLTDVDLREYLGQIAQAVYESHAIDKDQIKLQLNIDPIVIDLDRVINIGLLVNELVTNSLKYAFHNKENGTITVSLHKEDNHILLLVADDGEFVMQEANNQSYGQRLIATLTRGLGGEMNIETSAGTKTEIRIPVS